MFVAEVSAVRIDGDGDMNRVFITTRERILSEVLERRPPTPAPFVVVGIGSAAENESAASILKNFIALEDHVEALYSDGPGKIEDEEALNAALDPIREEQNQLIERLEAKPPCTLADFRLLARAIILTSPHLVEDNHETSDDKLVALLLRQLAG